MESTKSKKNSGVEKSKKSGQHLITMLTNNAVKEEEKEIVECKYGILCAHLRAQGKCRLPHKRSHYHFLNLAAPTGCLEDGDAED
jgi:hypothetical protein